MLKNQDGAIILETGVNKENNMLIPGNEMIIGKENKMEETERQQYQHLGSGSAILLNKRLNFMSTKKHFNNHKQVTSIVSNQNKTKWVLAGIHAKNGNGQEKWSQIKREMMDLKMCYHIP